MLYISGWENKTHRKRNLIPDESPVSCGHIYCNNIVRWCRHLDCTAQLHTDDDLCIDASSSWQRPAPPRVQRRHSSSVPGHAQRNLSVTSPPIGQTTPRDYPRSPVTCTPPSTPELPVKDLDDHMKVEGRTNLLKVVCSFTYIFTLMLKPAQVHMIVRRYVARGAYFSFQL